MSKFWTNGGSLVISNGAIVLCDSCPCGDVIADTGTGTSVGVDLESGIAVVGDCLCVDAEVLSVGTVYELDFDYYILCPFLWFRLITPPAGDYRIRINVIELRGLGINYTVHYGICTALTLMEPADGILATGIQCLPASSSGPSPGGEDIFVRFYGLSSGDGAHIVFVVENELCP